MANETTSTVSLDLLACVLGETNAVVIQDVCATLPEVKFQVLKGDVKDAIKYLARNPSPKLLVVDVTQIELPLSALQELSQVCEPSTEVIVVGARNDVGLYRDLMQMGVYDYLVTPLMPELLARSLKAALRGEDRAAIATSSREGKVITCIGARGGAGSTTLATNLAWIFAEEKMRKVAIVDLNLHLGTVSLYYDLQPGHGLREALENPDRIDDVFVARLLVKVSERLEVISSEESLDDNPEFTIEGFTKLIAVLKKKFHYVIIDVPRRFNQITRHVIENSSVMMIVADPSLASIRDVDRYCRQFGFEGESRRIITVLNKVGEYKRGEVTHDDFEKATKRTIHHMLPFDINVPLECANRGVILASQDSKLSVALRVIAHDLTGGMKSSATSTSLVDKIKGLLKFGKE